MLPLNSPRLKRHGWILVSAARIISVLAVIGFLIHLVKVIFHPDPSGLAGVFVLALLAAVAAATEILIGGRLARSQEGNWRNQVLGSAYSSRSERPSQGYLASVITLMTDNAERAGEYRGAYFGSSAAALVVPFVVAAIVAVLYDLPTGAVIVGLYACVPLLVGGFIHAFRQVSANSRKQRFRLAARYVDALRHLTTIRLLGAGERIEAELSDAGERNRRAIMRLLMVNQLVIIVIDGAFLLVLVVCTVAMVTARFQSGAMTDLETITVVALTGVLLEPLSQLAGFFYIAMGGRASLRALNRFLSRPRVVASRQDCSVPTVNRTSNLYYDAIHLPASQLSTLAVSTENQASEVAVELKNVSFSYGDLTVLKDFSVTIPVGSRVVIVGASGSGKSTLLDLIGGRLIPQAGCVQVAGVRSDPQSVADLTQLSATVSQRTRLFCDSIDYNLRIADPHATEEQLWRALERAQIDAVVRSLPQGLQTVVGEGGAFLSGGQGQRLSLARAFVSKRRILLLDEPTAHIDTDSERAILDAIRNLSREYTVIMVTHRPPSEEWADVEVRIDTLRDRGN